MSEINYQDVKIIEDKAGILKKGRGKGISIAERYAITEPLDIQNIEYWEARLDQFNIPYILAEVTIPGYLTTNDTRGYVLFTSMVYMNKFSQEAL